MMKIWGLVGAFWGILKPVHGQYPDSVFCRRCFFLQDFFNEPMILRHRLFFLTRSNPSLPHTTPVNEPTDLTSEIGPLKGYRALDDYELVFQNLPDAEEALAAFQGVLDSYQLKPNEDKTQIVELPIELTGAWPVELRQFSIRRSAKFQSRDLLDFFSHAFELSRENPKASVLRYAIIRIHGIILHPSSWPVYQNLLLQCANAEPGTLPHVTIELNRYTTFGCTIDKGLIRDTVEHLVVRHLPLGHGSEVAWAIWMAITLEVEVSKTVTDLLPKTNDPLVPLLSLHADQKCLLESALDTSSWESLMNTEELWGEHWLLSYEANVKGWLPSMRRRDHVDADPCFRFLKKQGVSFYNSRVARPVHIPRRWPSRLTNYAYEASV